MTFDLATYDTDLNGWSAGEGQRVRAAYFLENCHFCFR